MMICLVPTGVFAEGEAATGTAKIQFGGSGISGPTKITIDGAGDYYTTESYVCFGVNSDNSNICRSGDTVPADVSELSAFRGGFGLFLNRGDGAVEVTPDNYFDIFDGGLPV